MSPTHYASITTADTRIRVGARSHVGLVRQLNEDSFVAEGYVYAVADGMGGHAAGEVASQIAVLTLRDLGGNHPLRPDDIVDNIRESNRRILKSAGSRPETEGMGTTMAGVTVVRTGCRPLVRLQRGGFPRLPPPRQSDEPGDPRPLRGP